MSASAPYCQYLPAKERSFFMHMPIDPATIAIRAQNVTLSLGTRDDLGRPKTSTADAKTAFMAHLKAK